MEESGLGMGLGLASKPQGEAYLLGQSCVQGQVVAARRGGPMKVLSLKGGEDTGPFLKGTNSKK